MSDSSGKPVKKGSMRKGTEVAADGTQQAQRPQQVKAATAALLVAALSTVVASIVLFGQDNWIFKSYKKSNDKAKAKDKLTVAELHSRVDTAQSGGFWTSLVIALLLVFIAYSVWRGRYWARWGVLGFWALCSFTNMFVGITSLLLVTSDAPVAYKIPTFIAGAAMLVAIALVMMRPSIDYFALGRPAGRPAARRSALFGPRPAAEPHERTPATTSATASAATATLDRSRSKQRVETAAVTKGADLARTRAKAASKSRRRADG